MRYTESRLQSLTDESLLEDIESETVDFSDNFDGSQQEPNVLPAGKTFGSCCEPVSYTHLTLPTILLV